MDMDAHPCVMPGMQEEAGRVSPKAAADRSSRLEPEALLHEDDSDARPEVRFERERLSDQAASTPEALHARELARQRVLDETATRFFQVVHELPVADYGPPSFTLEVALRLT